MPQDTLRTGMNEQDFIILPDSIAPVVREYLHLEAQEKGFEKKSNNDEWTPLIITIGVLLLIWIIIRIRDGKSKTFVALGSMVNNETDYDLDENGNRIEEKPD